MSVEDISLTKNSDFLAYFLLSQSSSDYDNVSPSLVLNETSVSVCHYPRLVFYSGCLCYVSSVKGCFKPETVSRHYPRLVFYSGCLRYVSSVKGCLKPETVIHDPPVQFTGFDKFATVRVNQQGLNSDSKLESFCRSMIPNTFLLSSADYARDGTVILIGSNCFVLDLNRLDQDRLLQYIFQFLIS